MLMQDFPVWAFFLLHYLYRIIYLFNVNKFAIACLINKLCIMKSYVEKVIILLSDRKGFFAISVLYLLSASVVFYAVILLLDASGGFLRIISGTVFLMARIALRFFILLAFKTLPFILPPVILYLAASFLVKRRYLRYYVFLILFSGYIIWFIKFITRTDLFIVGYILELPEIFTALIQIYIFAALIIPDILVNFLASVFFLFKSFLVFVLPDLPLRFDDFGMIAALFIFTFLFLNNIVFIVKKGGRVLQGINFPSSVSRKTGGRGGDAGKK